MVNLEEKPDDFISIHRIALSDPNARGIVPVLECDDSDRTVLAESMVILDYLEDIVSPISLTAEQRARARLFANLFPGRLSSFGILKTEPGSEEEAAAVEKLRSDLRAMNHFLVKTPSQGPFLFGETFSYAEAATAPFAQRLSIVLPGIRPALDPKQIMVDEGLTRLAEWIDAVCTRPSCVESLPPQSELIESFGRLVEKMKTMQAAK